VLGSQGGSESQSASTDPGSQVASLPTSGRYDDPRGPGGLPLYACTSVGGQDCGQIVAAAFCSAKDYPQVASFSMINKKTQSETLSGERCTKKKCRVFEYIACQ
jgi:hypothetical protein